MKPGMNLCAGVVALACAALTGPTLYAETVTSKVEQLGRMSNVIVTGVRFTQRAGRLFLEATFSNSSTEDDQFEYRIKWLDRDGFSAGGEEAWKPVLMHGHQNLTIQSSAPVPEAADFRIEVHSPNNTALGTGVAGSTN